MDSNSSNAVLILEKDRDLADSIRLFLEDSYPVYIIDDPLKINTHVREYGIKLLVMDMDLAELNLPKNLPAIRSANPHLKIFLMYMFLDEENQDGYALLKEADDYIFKPFDADIFRYKVDYLLA
jgi:DNA-binding response OmpR family regulator